MLEAIINEARQPLTPDDYIITHKTSGQDTLQFTLGRTDPAAAALSECIRIYETTSGQTFWISGIDAGQNTVTFEGRKDLGDWERVVYTGYTNGTGGATAEETITGVLPVGWTLRLSETDNLEAAISLQGPTALEIVEQCTEVYGCGVVFDNCAKEVTLHFPEKKTLGPVFFVDTANLRAQPEYKGKATGIVTRLYAQGAGNMTFADINDGKNYIECFDYTDEVIAGYWRDERYTIPEHLLAAAREKLRALSQPEQSWSLEICDLHAIAPDKWPGLKLELFSVVRLIDRTRGSTMQAHITEIRSRPHHPECNEISISAVAGTLGTTAGSILRRLQRGTLYEGLEITMDRVKTTADQALEDAAMAQQEAVRAGNAAGNAQTAADNAQTAADNAQTVAKDAQTAAGEARASVLQLADSITLSVENGQPGGTAQITLGVDGKTQTGQIDLTGAVTFADLNTSGKTVIHGGNISTGLISAERIDTDGLFADTIHTAKLELEDHETVFPAFRLKGTNNEFSVTSSATSMGNPTSFVDSTGELYLSSDSAITLAPGNSGSGSGNSGVTVEGDLRVTGDLDVSGDLMATSVADYNNASSAIKIGYTGSALTASSASHLAAYSTTAVSGQTVIKDIGAAAARSLIGAAAASHTHSYIPLGGGTCTGTIYMNGGNLVCSNASSSVRLTHAGEKQITFEQCGTAKHVITLYGGDTTNSTGIGIWDASASRGVWVYNEVNNTFSIYPTLSSSSDRNLKLDIGPIPFDIIDQLEPVQFRMKDEPEGRLRYGFIAQDVEATLEEAGVDVSQSSLISWAEDENGEKKDYSLAYMEFIPMLVQKCQSLQRQLDALSVQVKALGVGA